MKATVLDLNGETKVHQEVDRISYINHESYGPATKIGIGEDPRQDERVLVVNVNAVATVLIDT